MAFDVNSNINTQLEDAIINTYFECELMGLREKLTKLDRRNFTSSFKKRIIDKINDCLDDGSSITLECAKIIDKTKGTNYEDEMLGIIAQNPLTARMVSDYHGYLAELRIKRELLRLGSNLWI